MKLKGFCIILSTLFLQTMFAAPSQNVQKQFIHSILTNTQIVNAEIRTQRNHLEWIRNRLAAGYQLNSEDQQWTTQLAKNYGIKNPNLSNSKIWTTLKKRVDVVPASLVIAQAIYESNWGQSRFAQLGNNYFGQRCYREGCGIVPTQRSQNARFEVRRYQSSLDSIQSYVHNLNTHWNYKTLRQIRMHLRAKDQSLSGIALAQGLHSYSTQKQYVTNIQSLMKHYQLTQYDT